jgi:DNA-directed RNA polymerase subunit RPC12/RpoP
MNFSSCGTRNTNLIDCPDCKYGTLDWTSDKTMKCADCNREYSVDKLKRLHVLPNVES